MVTSQQLLVAFKQWILE